MAQSKMAQIFALLLPSYSSHLHLLCFTILGTVPTASGWNCLLFKSTPSIIVIKNKTNRKKVSVILYFRFYAVGFYKSEWK